MILQSYNEFLDSSRKKAIYVDYLLPHLAILFLLHHPISDTDGKDQLSVSLEGNELMTFVIVAVKRSLLG